MSAFPKVSMRSRKNRFHVWIKEGLQRKIKQQGLSSFPSAFAPDSLAHFLFPSLLKPFSVVHQLTFRCNARCIHCDIWKIDFPETRNELKTEEVKELYQQISRWLGRVRLVITGGEAYLREDATELATFASQCGFFGRIFNKRVSIE